MLYVIKDWDTHFENHETRKLKRKLQYVLLPNKHDGRAFRRIMSEPDGASILGVWLLLVQLASKMPSRGLLDDGRGPLGVEDISLMTGATPEAIRRGISVLSSKKVGWIEERLETQDPIIQQHEMFVAADSPAASRNLPESREDSARVHEQNRTEQNRTRTEPAAAGAAADSLSPAKDLKQRIPNWTADEEFAPFVEAYREAKPDVIDEDFAAAAPGFRALDFEQKATAIAGVRARIAAGRWPGDRPDMVTKPQNYIAKGEWKRPVIAPVARAPDSSRQKAVLAIAEEKAARREAYKRNANSTSSSRRDG